MALAGARRLPGLRLLLESDPATLHPFFGPFVPLFSAISLDRSLSLTSENNHELQEFQFPIPRGAGSW